MKFIVGVLTGAVLGVAGAIAYSFKSGRDLREVFETTKSEIENTDFEALGQQFEARMGEMQAQFEERLNEVKANAQPVIEGAGEQIGTAVNTATEAINKARGKTDTGADDAARRASMTPPTRRVTRHRTCRCRGRRRRRGGRRRGRRRGRGEGRLGVPHELARSPLPGRLSSAP